MNYDAIFYWIGVASSAFFIMLGMSIFAAWVMNLVWRKFQEGKQLADLIFCWREFGDSAKEKRAATLAAEQPEDA